MFRNAVRSEMELLDAGGNQSEYYDFVEWFYRVCTDDLRVRFIFFIVARIFDSGQYVYDYCRRIYRVCVAFCFAGTYRQNAGGAYMV